MTADFLKALPQSSWDLEGLIYLEGEGGGQYTVYVKGSQVTVDQGLCDEPKYCVLRLRPKPDGHRIQRYQSDDGCNDRQKIKIQIPGID